MLKRKLANLNKIEKIHADIEVKFTAESGSSTIIPLGKNWKTLGIQLSGGLDSALLLFLTTKAIQEHNLDIKIQPISIFIPTKAKNIVATTAIIDKVRELTGANFINDGLVVNMPMESTSPKDGKKDQFFNTTVVNLFMENVIDFEFNGNTKNPPEHIRKYFDNDHARQKNRDNASSVYNSPRSASPHYNVDKRDIVNLYLKYDLINELAPLTISCDANIDAIHSKQSTVPCGQCWWCHERKYGFDSNNIIDPAPILTYEEYLSIPEKKAAE
jgi:hypothetical protein